MVYHSFPGRAMQLFAYNHAINHYKYKTKYMMFLDIDEFLVYFDGCSDGANIKKCMDHIFARNTKVGGIGLHWRIFGSSGHKKKPSGGVLENYLYRAGDDFTVNGHIKTVCNPRKVTGVASPHHLEYIFGYHCINEKGCVIEGAVHMPPSYRKLWIHHYFTKSREEWKEKQKRGKADGYDFRNDEEFNFHDRNEIYDDRMVKCGRKE